MRLRKNTIVERSAVNATRTFFESHGFVFQEVDLANDYGKDAYVDFADTGRLTGLCVALQIKGGKSYRTAHGYTVPVGAHEQVWRRSTVPIAGIVHDPETNKLHWCNITEFLRDHPHQKVSAIPVEAECVLSPSGLAKFCREMERTAAASGVAGSLLDLCGGSDPVQISAALDCFAHGRTDWRAFVLLRNLLRLLSGEPLRAALHLLSHVTPHPDILWTKKNWVPEEVCTAVRAHLRWDRDEVIRFFTDITWHKWQRGDTGEDLYMLLDADPSMHSTMMQVLHDSLRVLRPPNIDAAWPALYLTVYWAGEDGKRMYQRIAEDLPEIRDLPLAPELESILEDWGYLTLFE